MTGMYNVLEQLRRGEPLGAKERQVHEQGLVSVLRQLHDELDVAVLAAYGWADLTAALRVGSAARTLPTGGTGPASAGGTGPSPRPERLETGTAPLDQRFDAASETLRMGRMPRPAQGGDDRVEAVILERLVALNCAASPLRSA